jgi:hypothetical protein
MLKIFMNNFIVLVHKEALQLFSISDSVTLST